MATDQIREMTNERRARAEELAFFDANVWLGRAEGFPLAPELTARQLITALNDRFVKGGLLSHWRGKTISAQDGNRALADAMAEVAGAFYAIWTGLPLYPAEAGPVPGTGDLPQWVRGVRIFPVTHHFPLESWAAGPLCDWLVERRLPLFIWHTEVDWDQLYRLAKAFPKLRVVVESQPQKILYQTRPLFALMRDCPGVSLEISNFVGPGFVEYAVGEFGAERLLFGSFLPISDPLVPMGMILDSGLPADSQRLIAVGNLRRLIAEVRS